MANGTYLTLRIGTALVTTFTETVVRSGNIREVLSGLEADFPCYSLAVDIGAHLVEGKLLLGILLKLVLPGGEIITEADNDQGEVILAGLPDIL